jgi:ribonucleoside-diphosphate reductase subunit M2
MEVTLATARFYGVKIAIENIHNEMYLLLIDTYIKEPAKKMHLLCAFETVSCIQKKA